MVNINELEPYTILVGITWLIGLVCVVVEYYLFEKDKSTLVDSLADLVILGLFIYLHAVIIKVLIGVSLVNFGVDIPYF